MKINFNKMMMATVAITSLTACQKTDLYDPTIGETNYASSFENSIMDGQSIDNRQTWNTAVKTTVNVAVNLDYGQNYDVMLMAANPLYDKDAAYLGAATVATGDKTQLTIARPANVSTLFAVCMDRQGNYTVQRVAVEDDAASVSFGNTSATRGVTRGAAGGVSTTRTDYVKTLADYYDYNANVASLQFTSVADLEFKDGGNYATLGWTNRETGARVSDGEHYSIPAGVTFNEYARFDGGKQGTFLIQGTWNLPKGLKIESGMVFVLDGGTINADADIELNSGGQIVVKSGTINLLNGHKLAIENGVKFYNGGTISGAQGRMTVSGWGTEFYNAGSVDLGREFEINSDATIINAGHIKASASKFGVTDFDEPKAVAPSGSNLNIVNLCDLRIDILGVHNYIGCDGSLLQAPTGLMVDAGATLRLGKQAMVSVGGWYDNGGKYYGSTDADDYSVFKFTGTATEVNAGDFAASGYIYFDGTLIDQRGIDGYVSAHDQQLAAVAGYPSNTYCGAPIQYYSSEAVNPSTLTISKGDCNTLGYGTGKGGTTFTPSYTYYAFEDMGSTEEFDFNDVVVRISAPDKDKQSTVQLCALGGVYEAKLFCGDVQLGQELHQEFGLAPFGSVAAEGNTLGSVKTAFKQIATITNVTDPTALDINLHVNDSKRQYVIRTRQAGEVPYMICVSGNKDGKWFWATERTNISVAYGTEDHSFGHWGANYESDNDWYLYPVSGKVIAY